MAFSTTTGFTNWNNQVVLGPTGQPGTDHGQNIYVLRCSSCLHEYGANGSDIAIRRCPECGGGRPGFAVTAEDVIEVDAAQAERGTRNPNWTRDELILALDLYFDHPTPDQTQAPVIELSALLNRMWAQTGATSDTLRNPSGVSMKLSNFQRLDPAFQSRGNKGLAHGGRGDATVWEEFSGDLQRLRATAAAIRATIEQTPQLLSEPDHSEDVDAAEGAILTRLHRYRERDAGLAKKRKAQALAQHGRLACEACDFDFAKTYGVRGEGYIEVHHTKALETLEPGARTKLSDLAVLCANCHRVVHAQRPWLTMDQLRALVRPAAAYAAK